MKGGVDFAFIDGDHTIPGVTADLEALSPALNPGALVVLHDVFPELCGCDGPAALLARVRTGAVVGFECTCTPRL